jgi:voltage-gated potassium channel Kch
VTNRGVALVFGGLLVLATVVLRWMAHVTSPTDARVAAGGASLASIALLALLVFVRTLRPGPITRHRIEGAVAAHLLVGLTFALAYELIEVVSPGSLRLPESATQLDEGTLGYFSIVTLTTVGYGDVTPLSPLARRLAAAEGSLASSTRRSSSAGWCRR